MRNSIRGLVHSLHRSVGPSVFIKLKRVKTLVYDAAVRIVCVCVMGVLLMGVSVERYGDSASLVLV